MILGYPTPDEIQAWVNSVAGQAAQFPLLGWDGHDHPQAFLPNDPCEICGYLEAHKSEGNKDGLVTLHCSRHSRPVIMTVEHSRVIDLAKPSSDRRLVVAAIEWSEKDAQATVGMDDFGSTNRLGHFRVHVRHGVPYESMPEELRKALVHEAQEAAKWFFPDQFPDFDYLPVVTRRPISDACVRDRIQGFQYSIDREIARYSSYHFGGAWTDWRWRANWREKHHAWGKAFKEWWQTGTAQAMR